MILLCQPALAKDNYEEAVRKSSQVWYENSELKPTIDRFTRDIERKYVPVIIVKNGGILVFLVQGLASDQWKIGYKWDF